MGLVATATGLSTYDEFNCGYITYHRFIEELVKVAYDGKCYEIYTTAVNEHRNFTNRKKLYY